MGMGSMYLDRPLSILSEEISEFSKLVHSEEHNLPFWITKNKAMHQTIYRIKSLLDHIERYGNNWGERYPAWK